MAYNDQSALKFKNKDTGAKQDSSPSVSQETKASPSFSLKKVFFPGCDDTEGKVRDNLFGILIFAFSVVYYFVMYTPTKNVFHIQTLGWALLLETLLYPVICALLYVLVIKKWGATDKASAIFLIMLIMLTVSIGTILYEKPQQNALVSDANRRLEDSYHTEAQTIILRESGQMSTAERQQLITALAQKKALLANACQYTDRYRAEYEVISNRLELERTLVKTIAERGEPKVIRTIKPGEPILAGEVPRHSMITYLSLQEFKVYYSTGKTSIWSAASNEIGGKKIYHDKKMILQFEAIKKPTDIYFWVSEI